MKSLIVMSLIAAFSFNAEAGRGANREARQEKRIEQGVQSGELTKREAKKLERGQKKVDAYQQKASADGVMSPEEKLKLEKMQDRQSKKIFRQKHDEQRRGQGATPAPAVDPAAETK